MQRQFLRRHLYRNLRLRQHRAIGSCSAGGNRSTTATFPLRKRSGDAFARRRHKTAGRWCNERFKSCSAGNRRGAVEQPLRRAGLRRRLQIIPGVGLYLPIVRRPAARLREIACATDRTRTKGRAGAAQVEQRAYPPDLDRSTVGRGSATMTMRARRTFMMNPTRSSSVA